MIYLRLSPDTALSPYRHTRPFRAIVIIEAKVSTTWQAQVSGWLVESGCLYMLAWGLNCSTWDDSVDWANLEHFDYEVPKDAHVMTTWHENDTLPEVFKFAKEWAHATSDSVKIEETLLLHISEIDREREYATLFAAA